MKRKCNCAKDDLIRRMLKTFEDLGNDHWARIDARVWFKFYTRKAKKIGVDIGMK